MTTPNLKIEFTLLGILALLWGSSYIFIKVAVAEIPPVTLIAFRVSIAAVFLFAVLVYRKERIPTGRKIRQKLLVQSFFNSIGAWTVLAWGQQYIDSGLASVLNSTSPVFVFLISLIFIRDDTMNGRKLFGAILGLVGVTLIVGVDVLAGLGQQVVGQLAAITGAILYACAAIYGKQFSHLPAVVTATGTMVWASIVLIPASLVLEHPWTLAPSITALLAATILAVVCTGLALLIYFRLVKTLGAMGVTSQAYLRAGVGVVLGTVFLGEQITPVIAVGLIAVLTGVVVINMPSRKSGK